MRYGYFDDANREYVIERPDTPMPWTNYLGDRRYGSILSNNGIGYSFTRSPAMGRLLRYNYTAPTAMQPWRGFYLRDRSDGDYWTNFWQPVAKPLADYPTVCRMGPGYVVVESTYRTIHTRTQYFVPLGAEFEYWVMEVSNAGTTPRDLDIFSFAEFTTEWAIQHDVFNRQYSDYIVEADSPRPGVISQRICGRLPRDTNFANRDQSRWAYLALLGDIELLGFDADRDAFIGPYGSYAAPAAVATGQCSGSVAYGGHSCGAVHGRLILQPGERRTVLVMLGAGAAMNEGAAAIAEFGTPARAAVEFEKLKVHWAGLLNRFQCQTPDPAINSMVNVWNAANALMTFEWSRSCSLVYSGMDRDGFGFRDTVQDLVAAATLIPERTRDRLLLMLSGQESAGGAQPVVDPVHFKPGHMKPTPLSEQRADDCLWFFNAVEVYLAETGDRDLLTTEVPYADHGVGTVLDHLRRALEFGLRHRGQHGLVCGLSADWNDCIRLGSEGESVFVTQQLRYGLVSYARLATLAGTDTDAAWAASELEEVDRALETHAWDGRWYRRAFGADGTVFGSSQSAEGRVFLNPQSWAVISGAASPDRARMAMEAVAESLAGPHGIQLCTPAYTAIDSGIMRAVLFNPDQKENGGIFSHTQPWAVLAECLLGNGDRAHAYLRAFLPAAQNEQADLRQVEPYVHCQSTYGPATAYPGRSRVPWLSGTVAWTYHVMTQYVLGIRPTMDGLVIDPCIPAAWGEFAVERVVRGQRIQVRVENPRHVCRGVYQLQLDDGTVIRGNQVANAQLRDGLAIVAVMGGE
jgi:N,N'-diacetylchitobiose phosphorylase